MSASPIQYTSRTYLTALNDINADPLLADKPDWFKRLIAGFVDVASVLINAEANNGYLRTALTRRAVTDLCALIDYVPLTQVTASGTLMFDIIPAPTGGFPYTALQSALSANGPSTAASGSMRYGVRSSLVFSALTEAVAYTGINITNGRITVGAGTWYLGEKVRFTSTGSLPTGISANTDYFVSSVGTLYVTVTTTRALAFAGAVLIPSTQGTLTHTLTRLTRSIIGYQEDDVASYAVGNSDGTAQFQEFDITQAGVLSDTVTVTVLGFSYALVTTLALSAATDKVFRIYCNTDGSATIRFGNGVYGAIPPAGPVYVTYSYGGGLKTNLSALNAITNYSGGDADISGCYNLTTFVGGNDAETLDSAKMNAPMLLKARSRFVTIEDGIALAMTIGGLSQVGINANTYGTMSCQVLALATGGGIASTAQKSAIGTLLTNLSPIGAINVHTDDPTLTAVSIASSVNMNTGYSSTLVLSYADIATRLFFTETGKEIYSAYVTGGISSAVAKINTIFSKSFTSVDYSALTAIILQLNTVGARSFGDLITVSDYFGLLSVVPGVSYALVSSCSLALFSTTGYKCGTAEITTAGGTITVTAI